MLEVLSFVDREGFQPPSTVLISLVKVQVNEAFRGVFFLTIREKALCQISGLCSRSRPQIRGLSTGRVLL